MNPPAFDDADQAQGRSESTFACLAACGRPPVDRILLELAGEFGPVDRPGALDRVLRTCLGHPALLAAVYHEVARRAGVRASMFTGERDWYAPALWPRACPRGAGRLCRLFRALGRPDELAHAPRLRDLLPAQGRLGQSLSDEQEG